MTVVDGKVVGFGVVGVVLGDEGVVERLIVPFSAVVVS